MELRRQFLRSEFVNGGLASFRFPRGQQDLRAALGELPADFKTDAAVAAGYNDDWSGIAHVSFAEVLPRYLRELHRVRALLKTNDNAVARRPNVREAGLESPAGRFRACRIEAQADDPVAHLKNLRWLGVPIFKITEQPCEEIKDSVQPLINSTVRKPLDDFPAHVRREHSFDYVRI